MEPHRGNARRPESGAPAGLLYLRASALRRRRDPAGVRARNERACGRRPHGARPDAPNGDPAGLDADPPGADAVRADAHRADAARPDTHGPDAHGADADGAEGSRPDPDHAGALDACDRPAVDDDRRLPALACSRGDRAVGSGRALRLLRPPVVGRFRSARAQRIRVTVTELAPVCRHVGVFRLRLHKGRNVVRIPKRFAKPGSYALVGRAHGDDLFTLHARLVDRRRVRFDAIANVCRLGSATPELASTSSGADGGGRPTIHAKSATERKQAAPFTPPTHRSHSSPIVRAVSLGDAPTPLKPLLYGLLAVSILLLGAAALPQHVLVGAGRTGAVIAQRRGYIAAAGIWLLAVVAVVTIFA